MKIIKIINLFFFLFVINLSITFLYNNLFATYINGLLQTNHKNLWQRKQRELAEAIASWFRGGSMNSAYYVLHYTDKCCNVEVYTFKKMLHSMSMNPVYDRAQIGFDYELYQSYYKKNANREKIVLSIAAMNNANERFRNYIGTLNSFSNLLIEIEKTLKRIRNEYKFVKNILIAYLNESDVFLKEKILNFDYIRDYIASYPSGDTKEVSLSPERLPNYVHFLVNNVVMNLKEKNKL